MKRILILLSVCLLVLAFAACKKTDTKQPSTNDSSLPSTSSGFEIVIVDGDKTESKTEPTDSTSSLTQSELDQIEDDWDDIEVELKPATPSNKTETSSKTSTSSENKTSSVTSEKASSSQKPSSSSKVSSAQEPTSSKVTSLPDYYEGRS